MPFLDSEVLDWLIRYGYILMFLVMLVEGPAVTASAALGAALGHFNVFTVFVLSFFANFLPDVLYYGLGKWGGQWVLDRFGARVGIRETRRDRAAETIDRHLGLWLLFIKTIPFISPPGLAVMGALGIPIKRFIWWDAILVALTSLVFVLLGYFAGKGYAVLQAAIGYGPFLLAAMFLLFVGCAYLYGKAARHYSGKLQRLDGDESNVGD